MKKYIVVLAISQCLCIAAFFILLHEQRAQISALQADHKSATEFLYKALQALDERTHERTMQLQRMVRDHIIEEQDRKK